MDILLCVASERERVCAAEEEARDGSMYEEDDGEGVAEKASGRRFRPRDHRAATSEVVLHPSSVNRT